MRKAFKVLIPFLEERSIQANSTSN